MAVVLKLYLFFQMSRTPMKANLGFERQVSMYLSHYKSDVKTSKARATENLRRWYRIPLEK